MPLRFPRPVAPVIAAGMAAIWVAAASAPALADQTRQQEWWLTKLSVSQAWRASRGSGVTVAVLSDGINSTQADLVGSVTVGQDFTNTNETATTYVGLQGTPIASLIAGHGSGPGGTSGIVGVAPRARILSVRVTLDVRDPALDSATTGAGLPDAIANGIRYAVAHHAKVIDLPLDPGQPDPAQVAALPIPTNTGATTPPQLTGITAAAGGSTAEAAAVKFALRHNVVLIAPAGDNASGTDAVNYPAAYPGVISVGGFAQTFALAPYSNRQPSVTVTAPGEGVIAADATGGYAPVNSTTAASAIASGVAALIRSRFPGLPVAQVRHAMTSSTVFRSITGLKHGAGLGTVNAERAMAAAAAAAAPASQRAGAGSLPLSKPASPPAPTVQSDALKPRVLRAGLYAGGVLVILLLLIAIYAVLRGRRQPKAAEQVADWNPNPQPAYSPYGSGDPDRMMEFFAAPAGGPAPASGPFPQFQSSPFPGGQAASAQVPAGGLGADAGDGRRVGAWMPVGSGARGHSKPPQVSGAPPWEPAPQPQSELPWAAPGGRGPGAGGRATARPAAGPGQPTSGPAAAEAAWPVSTAGTTSPGAGTTVPPVAPAAPAPPAPTEAAPAAEAAGPSELAAPTAPAARATPAAPSPTGLAWEDLTDSSMTAIREPAQESAQAAGPPQRAAPATSRPRSPSGSDWERPDAAESADAADPAEVPDAQWDSVDGDAYRPPPADTHWQAPGSGARWRRNEPTEARRPRSASGSHRKTGGRGTDSRPAEVAEPRATEARTTEARTTEARTDDTGSFRSPAAPDPVWPADSAWPADEGGRGWDTAEGDNHWQSTSEAHWQSGDDTGWPASAGQPPWAPAAPAAEPEDSGWPEPASPRPDQAASAEKWQPADSARWQPAAADAMWGPPTNRPRADQDGEPWRPGASTETFPAIGEDS